MREYEANTHAPMYEDDIGQKTGEHIIICVHCSYEEHSYRNYEHVDMCASTDTLKNTQHTHTHTHTQHQKRCHHRQEKYV